MIKMVMTCSARCPICQRLIADKDSENLVTRVKLHAQLRHNEFISDVDIEDLSCVTRILGEKELRDSDKNREKIISRPISQK